MRSGCSSKTEAGLSLLGGALLGAAVMYVLDPDSGRRRRSQIGGLAHDTLDTAGGTLGSAWDRAKELSAVAAAKAAAKAADLGDTLSDTLADRTEGARSGLSQFAGSLMDRARHLGRDAADRARGVADRARDVSDDWADRAAGMSHPARHRLARMLDPEHVRGTGHAVGWSAAGVGTLVAGAALMYVLDPDRGRGRRAWVGQQVTALLNDTGTFFRRTGRHLMNRARGTAHEARGYARGLVPFGREEDTDGERLLARVRSQIGRVLTYPTQVQLMADANGAVTMYGKVPAGEMDSLLSTVNGVAGVSQIINRLEVCSTLGEVTGETAGAGRTAGTGGTGGSNGGSGSAGGGFAASPVSGQAVPQV